jgi:WD40 repeat protein
VFYTEGNISKQFSVVTDHFPKLSLALDKEEKFAYAGSKIGTLYIFKVNETSWTHSTTLYDHTQEITSICVSNMLNIFASGSLDGYINLYTMPSNRLFRSIQLKENITADYVSYFINFSYFFRIHL